MSTGIHDFHDDARHALIARRGQVWSSSRGIARHPVCGAKAAFCTGTLAGVVPAWSLDGGALAGQLQGLCDELVAHGMAAPAAWP